MKKHALNWAILCAANTYICMDDNTRVTLQDVSIERTRTRNHMILSIRAGRVGGSRDVPNHGERIPRCIGVAFVFQAVGPMLRTILPIEMAHKAIDPVDSCRDTYCRPHIAIDNLTSSKYPGDVGSLGCSPRPSALVGGGTPTVKNSSPS